MEAISDFSAWEHTVTCDSSDRKTDQIKNLPSVEVKATPPAEAVSELVHPCTKLPEEEMFGIIDVCSSRRLFDTFRAELLASTAFSFAVAVDREKISSEEGNSGNVSSSELCRVDSGVVGRFTVNPIWITTGTDNAKCL